MIVKYSATPLPESRQTTTSFSVSLFTPLIIVNFCDVLAVSSFDVDQTVS